jgi:hypothetical protein
MKKLVLAMLLLLLPTAALAQATNHTVTLVWQNPTTRTDGTPLAPAQIASVEVFAIVGGASTSFGFQTSPFITPKLNVGTYSFSLILTDTGGQTSMVSNSLQVTVPATVAPPNPPTLTSATLN